MDNRLDYPTDMFLQYYWSIYWHNKSHLWTAYIPFPDNWTVRRMFFIDCLGHTSILCRRSDFWISSYFSEWQDIFGTIAEMDRMQARTITVIQNIFCIVPLNTFSMSCPSCFYGMVPHIHVLSWDIRRSFCNYILMSVNYLWTRHYIHRFFNSEKTVYWDIPIDKAWNRTDAAWCRLTLRTWQQPAFNPQLHSIAQHNSSNHLSHKLKIIRNE